jgi:branched-chain amino acid aminotransferase
MRVALLGGEARVECATFAGYPEDLYGRGAVAEVAADRGHPLGDLAGHKILPYAPLDRLREAARARGAVDVVLRDRDGALLEGCASNLFLLRGGELLTPPLTRPILPGVTRAAAIQAARDLGVVVRERDLRLRDLRNAEGAFLTGSLMEALPLRGIADSKWEPVALAGEIRNRLGRRSDPAQS